MVMPFAALLASPPPPPCEDDDAPQLRLAAALYCIGADLVSFSGQLHAEHALTCTVSEFLRRDIAQAAGRLADALREFSEQPADP
jgi:hypothetical protein